MDTLPCFESGMSSSFSTVRVRENFSYPLVLLASTILHLVVLNPRGFVQKVLLETQEQLIINFNVFNHPIILVNYFLFKPEMESS